MSLRSFDTCNGARGSYVDIKVKVMDVGKTFNFRFAKGKRIKEIGHQLAELLNLDSLRTNFVFTSHLGLEVLSPTSTLLQNNVRSGDTLVAKMLYTGYNKINMATFSKTMTKTQTFGSFKPDSYIDEKQYGDYELKSPTDVIGMKLIGICQNPKCVTEGKKVTFLIGVGNYFIMDLLTDTKCSACKKPVNVSNISLSNCVWKIEGNFMDSNGFLNFKTMKSFNRTEGTDNESFYEKLRETKYSNPKVIIKSY